jgi:monofunctional biosynthetic peptidoglycan transglycosylase
MKSARQDLVRWLGMVLVVGLSLQIFFIARIALMSVLNPQSTSFQRSEAYRVALSFEGKGWHQEWVSYDAMAPSIKRAVIASEDDEFAFHGGVQWDAIEAAWQKNTRAQEQAEKRLQALQKQAQKSGKSPGKTSATGKPPKIVGGSTITQQLAKNLLLSGERNLLRKAQEFALTLTLEALLSKERILEIYLNSVEWGEGIFGVEAAARHYFHKNASQLSNYEAARLAVMLPRPKTFEKQVGSAYLQGRAGTIVARMPDVSLP